MKETGRVEERGMAVLPIRGVRGAERGMAVLPNRGVRGAERGRGKDTRHVQFQAGHDGCGQHVANCSQSKWTILRSVRLNVMPTR